MNSTLIAYSVCELQVLEAVDPLKTKRIILILVLIVIVLMTMRANNLARDLKGGLL